MVWFQWFAPYATQLCCVLILTLFLSLHLQHLVLSVLPLKQSRLSKMILLSYLLTTIFLFQRRMRRLAEKGQPSYRQAALFYVFLIPSASKIPKLNSWFLGYVLFPALVITAQAGWSHERLPRPALHMYWLLGNIRPSVSPGACDIMITPWIVCSRTSTRYHEEL